MNKYRLTKVGEVGPGRTNKGWEWKEHKVSHRQKLYKVIDVYRSLSQFVPHQGYLYRRIVRYVPSTLVNYPLGQTELDQSANQTNDDEEDLEDAEDSALLPQQQDVSRSTRVKIEIEQYIVYSKTYRVPMYCFRAWDEGKCDFSHLMILTHHASWSASLHLSSSQVEHPSPFFTSPAPGFWRLRNCFGHPHAPS